MFVNKKLIFEINLLSINSVVGNRKGVLDVIKKKIVNFIKKETVLSIAALLALFSMFLVMPDIQYFDYIDTRVLAILFSLMVVMSGFGELGVFEKIGTDLLRKTKNVRQLEFVLIFLCFFCSMLITNDVSLLTFVPFALLTLKMADKENEMIFVVVMQTIAANLGSMFTPIGNPQNLYLYSLTGMPLGTFLWHMFPYTLVSAILLAILIFLRKAGKAKIDFIYTGKSERKENLRYKLVVYIILLFLSLLTVARILPYELCFLIILGTVWIMDKKILKSVDYCLLFTFVCFFIFIGNMERIPAVNDLLKEIVTGHEVAAGVISSQVVSNVPAALLLSGFTSEYEKLLFGVNFGGLGTMIASMASLISYKLFVNTIPKKKQTYFLNFTGYNLLFLMILLVFYLLGYKF